MVIKIKRKKLSPALVSGLLVGLVFGIALWLRAYLPHDKVFTNNLIKFAGTDSYYHMRLVENLLRHFTHPITFDPFTYYPHGTTNPWPSFFDWLLAGIIWLVSLGSPSQHLVDVVGVYYPAVLGSLTWFGKRAMEIRKIIRDDMNAFDFCQRCPFKDRPVKDCDIKFYDLQNGDLT